MALFERFLTWRARTARPPLTLGEKAARYGALACVLGFGLLAVPVSQGVGLARSGAPAPDAGSPWAELRLFGWELVQGTAGGAR